MAALLLAVPALAGPSGTARVIDGDTLDIGGDRVRLHGIDAPEQDQTCTTEQGAEWACGAWVTTQVNAMLAGKRVDCTAVTIDRYDRIVARCEAAGQDIGDQIVAAGLAFAYRKYSMDYDLTEKQAAVADRGLWAMNVTSPAWHRQTRAVGRLPVSAACVIKGNISSKGVRIFHVPGQVDYERTGIRVEKGERWFCSELEAVAAGWRKARR